MSRPPHRSAPGPPKRAALVQGDPGPYRPANVGLEGMAELSDGPRSPTSPVSSQEKIFLRDWVGRLSPWCFFTEYMSNYVQQ